MADVLVSTSTIITVDTDAAPDTFLIRTFYDRMLDCDDNYTAYPYTLEALIADGEGLKNNVPFEEGELLITMKSPEYPTYIDFWLDNGRLIVAGNDAGNYYVDDQGHLIYDACFCDGNTYVECNYVEDNYVE